ncbi:MAG: hypothetical protein ABL928_03860 [Sphingorhabdus sp.]|uniref:hypothetical protein n=1 Tax=Sphingorhabdus sp. TaxID=1902408 RepID=UPI0032B8E620
MSGTKWTEAIRTQPDPKNCHNSLDDSATRLVGQFPALALMSLWGFRLPMQMLPLMIYEIAWKTTWIILIAGRAWMADKWTPDIERLFYDCIGIIIAYFIVPWRYVWVRYVVQPMEPLRAS